MQVTTASIKEPAALVYRKTGLLLVLRSGLLAEPVVHFLAKLLHRV